MRPRKSRGSADLHRHAIERDRAAPRIVEAQQEMKDRALAGAGGTDDRDLLAGPHRQRDGVEHADVGPPRIGEADAIEPDLAARRHRQRARRGGRRDLRLHTQDLEQALGGARGGRDLAPDLAELAEPRGGEGRIEHELAEPARRDGAGEHVMRTDPEDRDHACEHDEDDDGGEHRARLGRGACRLIGLLDLAAEALRSQPLAGIGLHGADRADQLAGIGGSVGERYPARCATAAAPSARKRPAAARSGEWRAARSRTGAGW